MHVLRASTGQAVDPFPFRVFGKVMSPPLLTKLDDPKELGLQIVLTAFDGFLYIIDGPTGGWALVCGWAVGAWEGVAWVGQWGRRGRDKGAQPVCCNAQPFEMESATAQHVLRAARAAHCRRLRG